MVPPLPGQKIVHLLTTVHHGGAERVVLELARRQRELGADAQVLCLQGTGDLLPAFNAAGIPVSRVPSGSGAGALRMAWSVAGVLRAAAPEIVHTHNSAPQIAAGLGQRLRRWRRKDAVLVHTEHGRMPDLRRSLLRWRRWAAAEFDEIVAVSADAQSQMLKYGVRSATGVTVILNGVNLSQFPMRDASRVPGAHLVHVGRLDPIKGQDVLIAAMPEVRRMVPSAMLTIVGDGPARRNLEAQARDLGVGEMIQFTGARDDVRPFLEMADVFVLPSRSEGISIALLEAMACGLPVVATDVGGNREVVTERSGMLVPSERPDQLAAAIVSLLTQPEVARAKGVEARQEVARRFGTDRVADDYAKVYARVSDALPVPVIVSTQ